MGIALAYEASALGAEVDLVLGPVNLTPSGENITVTHVTTAATMEEACIYKFRNCDIAILSAAVADFTPAEVKRSKMKKGKDEFTLPLRPTTEDRKSVV